MNGAKTYTAKDIERYHGGQLSAAEMHALEMAALDDPFLADALEGFAHTRTPSTDLASLQKRLAERIEEKDKRKLFFIGTNWMKVAALFIVFAGGGWLVFRMLSDKAEPSLAKRQPAVERQITASPNTIPADSTSVAATAPATGASSNNGIVTNEANETVVTPKEPVIVNSQAQLQQRENATAYNRETEDSKNKGYIAGITTFRQGNTADSSRYQSNASAKERSNVLMKPAAPSTDTIRNVDIVMKRSDLPAAEVVVINKSKAERKDVMSRMKVKVDTLEPAEGWTHFDDYVASNLKQPEELKTKPVHGEVELSFEVNQKGEPVNIAVVRSLCEKCDEEAIRLLKEGPKWNKKKKKGKVKIRF